MACCSESLFFNPFSLFHLPSGCLSPLFDAALQFGSFFPSVMPGQTRCQTQWTAAKATRKMPSKISPNEHLVRTLAALTLRRHIQTVEGPLWGYRLPPTFGKRMRQDFSVFGNHLISGLFFPFPIPIAPFTVNLSGMKYIESGEASGNTHFAPTRCLRLGAAVPRSSNSKNMSRYECTRVAQSSIPIYRTL
jgi:hypothetical protein